MTAIDWLDNELQKEIMIENTPERTFVVIPLDTYMNRKAQAKKMEKEQMKEACYFGAEEMANDESWEINFERDFYNRIYKSEKV